MKGNLTQEPPIATLLDILKDPGVTSFMIPQQGQSLKRGNARFFEDVEFARGERTKDFVFKEEYIDISQSVINNDQDQDPIPDIVQEPILDQDIVIEPPF